MALLKLRKNLFRAEYLAAATMVVAQGLAALPARAADEIPSSFARFNEKNIEGCLSDVRTLTNTITPPDGSPERAIISKSHNLICLEYSDVDKWAVANADGTTEGNKETSMRQISTAVIFLDDDNAEAEINNVRVLFMDNTIFSSETRFIVGYEGKRYAGSLDKNGNPPKDDDKPENVRPVLRYVANLAAKFPELIK